VERKDSRTRARERQQKNVFIFYVVKEERLAGKEKWVYMCFIANLSHTVALLS
jgi:hypothetical protein